MAFEEGTQSTELLEVPIVGPGLSEGPNEIASSLRETVELIQMGLVGEPEPKNIRALSILVGVLSLPVDHLALPCGRTEDTILYNLRHSFQFNLRIFCDF